MKTKWMLLLVIVALMFRLGPARNWGGSSLGEARHPAGEQPFRLAWQQATPEPTVSPITPAENATPRPPSEAGQNMVLIIGAAMLVLIVFLGVAVHTRKPGQSPWGQH